MSRQLPPLSIRPVLVADLAAIRALHVRSFAKLARSHHSLAQIQAHADMVAEPAYEQELLSNNLLVAEDSRGCILGTAGWRPLDGAPTTARIRKVFMAPEVAGRGLGRRLVGEAEAHARRAGFERLYVRANVNAAPFYERLGYRALERGSMPAGGEELPVVYMEKA
jgi:GNAT superfamily N-acetyltransferase